ncbi:MAG: RluA family pseudouridine synthase [Bacilli bacterium]
MVEIKVSNNDKERLDKYLTNELKTSRSKIQKLIDQGKVLVNDKLVKSNYIVNNNDIIKVNNNLGEDNKIKPKNINLDIVYEDDDVMVINKPIGMVVHPASGHYDDTLVNGLLGYSKELSDINGNFRPGIIHRIDKDTSGLLLIAKNNNAHLNLSKQLENKIITRKYSALVHGVITHDKGTIDAPIGRDKTNRKKMAIEKDGKKSITHFIVLERYKEATLIECKLETGRTHQIRVHMEYISHPIINDPLYGKKKVIDDSGQMLHAKTIGFTHPTTNKYMEFEVPIPDDFNNILMMFKD